MLSANPVYTDTLIDDDFSSVEACSATFRADWPSVTAVRHFAVRGLTGWGVSRRHSGRFELALAELSANLLEHGKPVRNFELRLEHDGDLVRADLAVAAGNFDDENEFRASAADLDALDPLSESGRGLALVMHSFPSVRYVPANKSGDGSEHYVLEAEAC